MCPELPRLCVSEYSKMDETDKVEPSKYYAIAKLVSRTMEENPNYQFNQSNQRGNWRGRNNFQRNNQYRNF